MKIVRLGTRLDRPNGMRFLKKVVVASVLLLTMSVYLLSERTSVRVHAKVFGGPPLGFTGAPDEGTCIGCHYTFGQPNVPGSGGSVALSGLPATYSPGQTYTVTVTVVHPTARRWGFETTPIDAAGTSSTVGTLTILDQVRTIKREAGARTYISHYAADNAPASEDGTYPGKAGSNSWTFNWTAPPASTGDVTFYAVGNAANNQVTPEDDYIYTTSAVVRAPNSAPVFASLPDRALSAGDRIAFNVIATDPEGAQVALTASPLTNSSFDSLSGRFVFTAGASQLGTTQQVTFTASDGSVQTQKVVNLVVVSEGAALLSGLLKPTGASNYLDSSEASGFELTANGTFGSGAKVVFNGLELTSQLPLSGPQALAAQVPASELTHSGAYIVRVRLSDGTVTNGRTVALAASVNAQAAATVDAAAYRAPGAPSQIATVFGTNLIIGSTAAAASTIPLPGTLAGATVFVNGVKSPLFYAGAGQINIQIPSSTTNGQAEVVVLRDDGVASHGTLQVAAAAPAVFTANSTGEGQAAALNPDFSPNGDPAAHPQFKRGVKGSYVVLFASGNGTALVNTSNGQPAVIKDGESAPQSPLIGTLELPVVTIGGKTAVVYFSGLAPGYVGFWQLNVQIPPDSPSGAAVEVLMTFGGRNSNRVTIAVE